MLKSTLKNFLKKHLLIFKVREKFSPSVQITQRQLMMQYKTMILNGNYPKISETGFSVFSQYEEDGILLYLFSIIGMQVNSFIEIGSDDGINSNCANLAFNFGWYGLFIDANKTSIDRGKRFYARYPDSWRYKPKFVCSKVTRENINDIIKDADIKGEVGLLSIDIDGNDYWIWDAISEVQPQVVLIESHIEFGFNNVVVPYDAHYNYKGKDSIYHGASPVAIVQLAKRKGYRLIGTNLYGHNLFFVKNGIADKEIKEVRLEDCLTHPNATESFRLFEKVKNMEFLEG